MNEIPYEAVLGQKVAIREDGVERKVTAAEAFLLHLTKRGLEGDGAATRAALAAVENARAVRQNDSTATLRIQLLLSALHEAIQTLPCCPLRMAIKLDRFRDTARIALEPWLVEAALAALVTGASRSKSRSQSCGQLELRTRSNGRRGGKPSADRTGLDTPSPVHRTRIRRESKANI